MKNDFAELGRAINALGQALVAGLQEAIKPIEKFSAWMRVRSLEIEGRKCHDRRKRNRYFRKAKRIRRAYNM